MSTFLKSIFKKESFTSEELELILNQFEYITFKKNEYLIQKDKVSDFYYFLEEGYARSFVIDTFGNEVTTKFFSNEDIVINWNSYFLKVPSQEYIQAISSCKCWKITFINFMKLFHIDSFREVGRTRLVQDFFELKNRSVSIIADQAKDRYLFLMKEKPDIIRNVPLKYVASYLGVTDTSLSRIRKDIKL